MVLDRTLDWVTDTSDPDAATSWQVPGVVVAMLHNVYLCREKTTPPVEHRGDFWFWKLTAYGLTLMLALVRASSDGFSYAETFVEPEPETIPQLVLLTQINDLIHSQLTNTALHLDWEAILDDSPYLQHKDVTIDTPTFQREVDYLMVQIRQGRYDLSGNRTYPCPNRPDSHLLSGSP